MTSPALILLVALSILAPTAGAEDVTTLTAPDGTTVVIYRDNYGVPHIRASTEAGVFYGQGYAVAQDRLFQMETFRRAALGRLSEVKLGSITTDQQVRATTYTSAERAAQLATVDPAVQSMIASYVAGINTWLESVHADPLAYRPIEFFAPSLGFSSDDPKPWSADDVVAVSQFIMRRFGQYGGQELTRLAELSMNGPAWFNENRPINDPAAPTTIPAVALAKAHTTLQAGKSTSEIQVDPEVIERIDRRLAEADAELAEIHIPPKLGSFAVIAAPSKTATGNVMLLGAPQLSPPQRDVANMTHEVELDAPTLHVAGMSVAGVPGVIIGHTDHHAWTLTSGNSDNTDTFIEVLNQTGTAYLHDGSYQPFEIIPEPDLGATFARYRTVHGPVIGFNAPTQAFSWQMTFWKRELEMVEAFYNIWKAENLEEFEAQLHGVPMNFNVLYAGSDQQIKYYHVGTLLRNTQTLAGPDPRLPRLGEGSQEWDDDPFLSFEELPQASAQVQNYFVNWNNKPAPSWNNGDNIPWSLAHRPERTLRVQAIDEFVSDLQPMTFEQLKDVPRQIDDHGTYQQVIEFTPGFIRNENVIPPGQSGFTSVSTGPDPHFSDQWALHEEWAFKNMAFNEPVRVWPLNKKFWTIQVEDFVDTGDPSAAFLQSVWSDEDSPKSPIRIDDCTTVSVRADRDGDGNGRIYTVHMVGPDPAGYTGTAALFQMYVPKSASPAHAFAADDGPAVTKHISCEVGKIELAKAGGAPGPRLKGNRPNPFNPTTRIEYDVTESAQIVLSVYNLLGQEVRRLVDREQEPGTYSVAFDAAGLSSGLYFYTLRTPGSAETRMMILQK